MSIQIDVSGKISLNGTDTGYGVKQTRSGTVVYALDFGRFSRLPVKPAISLPAARYSLAHDTPASGVPGFSSFEKDFLEAYRTANP